MSEPQPTLNDLACEAIAAVIAALVKDGDLATVQSMTNPGPGACVVELANGRRLRILADELRQYWISLTDAAGTVGVVITRAYREVEAIERIARVPGLPLNRELASVVMLLPVDKELPLSQLDRFFTPEQAAAELDAKSRTLDDVLGVPVDVPVHPPSPRRPHGGRLN